MLQLFLLTQLTTLSVSIMILIMAWPWVLSQRTLRKRDCVVTTVTMACAIGMVALSLLSLTWGLEG